MQVKTATFVSSGPDLSSLSKDNRPEYAFIGRSNVGKSSLINMLCNQRKLAKTSSTPGKTRLINHFIVNESWYLVDLPGYGFARLSHTERDRIDRMVRNYLLKREQLMCVFVLIDSRLEPQKTDLDFIDWLGENGVPFVLIFTKTDKEAVRQVNRNVNGFMQALGQNWEELPQYFLSSSETRAGREEILTFIEVTNSKFKIN